jgi:hypothetical protein
MKAIVLSTRNATRRPYVLRDLLVIPLSLLLVCFALLPNARAVNPPPDGGYPNGNTAEGSDALFRLTSGSLNTALGLNALYHNTIGNYNTASGANALISNTSGSLNTANGVNALYRNTIGVRNTATGVQALFSNTTGSNNTAGGISALYTNTTGNYNTATGRQALYSNTTGDFNTANGVNALLSNINGASNTACGVNALQFNTLGSSNTALGIGAGSNVTTANNVICIGNSGDNHSNSCYIGNIFLATIDPGTATAVGVDANGKLGTVLSSKRFKEEIKPMDKASEVLLSLKPVTFRYKDYKESPPQFGLIAEEVAEVNPDLVIHDKKGEVCTVRYEAVNAMLLNEFLKEHKKVEKLESKLAEQEKKIEALTSGLQRVSAQLEMSHPAPRAVLNQ